MACAKCYKPVAGVPKLNTEELDTFPKMSNFLNPLKKAEGRKATDKTSPGESDAAHSNPVRTIPDQTTGPVQTITAQHGGNVKAVLVHGNVFHGTVQIQIGADSMQTGQTGGSTNAVELSEEAQRKAEHEKLKVNIIDRYSKLYEGTAAKGKKILLSEVYSELYVVEDWRGGVNTDHEVIQIETGPKRHALTDSCMKFSEIFHGNLHVRKVLTMGIAGIGKTISVQKFALDWAEGKSNTDIEFVFVVAFRELNLLENEEYDLQGLLLYLYPELKLLKKTGVFDGKCKCAFILDGLDELRKPLDFTQKRLSSTTKKAPVEMLVANLITGALLPSALVWITSRPAAADQIPLDYIDRVTEVRGFVTDQQKEEYFKKRIQDEEQASMVISHIKQLKTLYIMCYIPVFCWITYTVLQEIMKHSLEEIPKTLTQMYVNFLTIQMDTKRKKYTQTHQKDTKKLLESNKTELLKLAKLAFKQLMKDNMMFSEEDLKESRIDVSNSEYSGIFTEIFKEESGLYQRKVYCFVHLSFQEFLAAVYVLHCYEIKNMEELLGFKPQDSTWSGVVSLDKLLEAAVDTAVRSPNGHLDLFLRFLLGISVESNQKLLKGLLTLKHTSSEKTTWHIKCLIDREDYLSPERSINLFLCLSEMNDQSLSREIQKYLKSEKHSEKKLTPGQCSALAYMLLNSEKVLEELDLQKYNTSLEGYRRLVPVVSICQKALLAGGGLTESSYETIGSALYSKNCPLKELDLSYNNLPDSVVDLISNGLKKSTIKLETLRLVGCNLTTSSHNALCSSLKSENCSLKELDLSNNNLQDSEVEFLSAVLKSAHCKLESLRLTYCALGGNACKELTSALQSMNSCLKYLDLSNNDLQDSGVELICAGLKSLNCKLETLRLSGCMVTEKGYSSLASALKSNPSHLGKLDLTYNYPGESGVKLLSDLLQNQHYRLDTLWTENGGTIRIKPGLKKYTCFLTLDPKTPHGNLILSEGNRKVTNIYPNHNHYPDNPERFDHYNQVLCVEGLTGRCYWEAEWSGEDVAVAMAYRGITRRGDSREFTRFDYTNISWCLKHYYKTCSLIHNNYQIKIPNPLPNRVGVYLDWPAGTLSYYSITPRTNIPTHLHTFYCRFREPLYAGFAAYQNVSVRLL